MRLIDADGVVEEIKRNKLLAREPATVRCIETIKNATTYVEPPRKSLVGEWIPVEEQMPGEPKENPIFDNKLLELYLVSIKNSDYAFRAFWNGLSFTDGWSKLDVLAWMPLPDPYRPNVN